MLADACPPVEPLSGDPGMEADPVALARDAANVASAGGVQPGSAGGGDGG